MRVAVFGASGGIGRALVQRMAAREDVTEVVALSRQPEDASAKILPLPCDITDEASVAAAAQEVAARGGVERVLVASGVLHQSSDGLNEGPGESAGQVSFSPEKSLKEISAESFAQVLLTNTIGPSLVIKHFSPLLPARGPSVMGVLSARVGSISDNQLGGWYSYRASKAALNMIIKTASIELKRRRPDAVLVGLHPGTVATGLSAPFQGQVKAGKLFTPDQSAGYLLQVVEGLAPGDTGRCLDWQGREVAP